MNAMLPSTSRHPFWPCAGLLLRELGRESADVLAQHASEVAPPAFMAQVGNGGSMKCCGWGWAGGWATGTIVPNSQIHWLLLICFLSCLGVSSPAPV